MKKRITVIAVALALLTLTAASGASASFFAVSGSGVLVRQGDGYRITGTTRDVFSGAVGSIHGTLIERTTGFNTCPEFGIPFPCGNLELPIVGNCNLLGGVVTLNFQGTSTTPKSRATSMGGPRAPCAGTPVTPPLINLTLFMWSESQVIPGEFPDIFALSYVPAQQISPKVWKWSS